MPATSVSPSRKRISIDDIRAGMYCADVFNDEGAFILSAHITIANPQQIVILKRLGVKFAEIDIEKGCDVAFSGAPNGAPGGGFSDVAIQPVSAAFPFESSDTIGFSDEMPIAKETYRRTILAAKNAFNSVRKGTVLGTREIEDAVLGIVESVLRNKDAIVCISQIRGYDEYLYEHSVNVAVLVCALCYELGYRQKTIVEAGIGGLLHDIGMAQVPERIVNKAGPLTEKELVELKRHPLNGLEMVEHRNHIPDMSRIIIAEHHERLNGKGYHRGLKEDQIHEQAFIAGLADMYDAMTSPRVHRSALTPQQALANVYSGIDNDFPRTITENFVKMLGVYPVGSFVRLTSGELGVVLRVRRNQILAPDVLVLFSEREEKLPVPKEYRLSEVPPVNGETPCSVEKSLDPRLYDIQVAEYVKGQIGL